MATMGSGNHGHETSQPGKYSLCDKRNNIGLPAFGTEKADDWINSACYR